MRVQKPVTDGADRCGCRHKLQTGRTDAGADTSYRRDRQMRVQTPVTDGTDRCGCRHQLQTGQTDAGADTSYRRGRQMGVQTPITDGFRQMRVQTPADVNKNKEKTNVKGLMS